MVCSLLDLPVRGSALGPPSAQHLAVCGTSRARDPSSAPSKTKKGPWS